MGRRGIAPLILTLATRWRWVVSSTPWPIYPRRGKKSSSLQVGRTVDLKVGRDILEKRKFIAPDGIQSPNLPARS